METAGILFRPSLTPFTFNAISTVQKPLGPRNHSFYNFTSCRKPRTSSVSVSSKTPPDEKSPDFDGNNTTSPLSPSWVLVRAFKSIKDFAYLYTQKLVSRIREYDESEGVVDGCSGCGYSQNGGIGIALLSLTYSAKVKISPFVATLAANPTFVSGFLAWFFAQSVKVILNFYVERIWDLRILFACGGMPSSHSALCTALTTSVALCHGMTDSLFPVCLGFSLIVMYDAIGVRRHAGMQAEQCGYLEMIPWF
ncbi:uncharacterized protein LOC115677989 isoform X2 [Syzygium oleosum]|uniref:uncharacterized protein LOC115677989 isoform X2 n=1 Tax=Syzygium oleosum TaxID=219896 RepID=UPI0024BA0AE8|nr:uncharacterized protein LOC115677989 isoform X2 [Syzygium oleosum]